MGGPKGGKGKDKDGQSGKHPMEWQSKGGKGKDKDGQSGKNPQEGKSKGGKGKDKDGQSGKHSWEPKSKGGKGKDKDGQSGKNSWEPRPNRGKGKDNDGQGRDNDGQGWTDPMEGRSYKHAIQDVCNNTQLIMRDIDQKAVQLLDALQKAGKVDAAIQHLKTSLSVIETREKVKSWNNYCYKLLRDFDAEVYTAYKEKAAASRQRGAIAKKETAATSAPGLNTTAPAFTPGQWWSGSLMARPPGQL